MPQDAKQVAAATAQGFKLLQCEACADKVQKALIGAGYAGHRIELRADFGHSFMGCLSYDGAWTSITLNGRHLGIRVGDVVFDNLHPQGMEYEKWLGDFVAPFDVILFRIDAF